MVLNALVTHTWQLLSMCCKNIKKATHCGFCSDGENVLVDPYWSCDGKYCLAARYVTGVQYQPVEHELAVLIEILVGLAVLIEILV